MSTPLPVRLAESFASKPVRPPLMELIEELVDANLDGFLQKEGTDAERACAIEAERLRAEIQRRIDELGGGL